MNEKIIAEYCWQVKKRLICKKETKEKLLRGLKDSLEDIADPSIHAVKDLEVIFGSVAQTAEDLQNAISIEEKEFEYHRQQRLRILKWVLIGAVLCLSILLFYIGTQYFINGPYYVVETITEG